MRKSLPQLLAASKVIRSESGAPITTPHPRGQPIFCLGEGVRPPSRRMGVVIGAPFSDKITFEAANIWGKLSLSRKPFRLDPKDFH